MSGYKTMHGTIWVSGRNYVTSLPTDFGKKIEMEYDSRIEKTSIGDKIIITPPFDPFKRRILKTTADPSDFAELKTKAVSAYISGYDEVDFSFESPIPGETIEKLQSSIAYVRIEPTSPTHYRMFFADLYQISLKDVFAEVKETFKELNSETQEIFKAVSRSPSGKKVIPYLKNLETRLDTLTFQVRRYLNKALSYSGLYDKLGLQSDKDIIHLSSIFGFFERLGDLHLEIGKKVQKISVSGANLDISSFLSYYNHAYETIPVAIEAQEDPWRGLEVIRGKVSEWELYKGRILELDKENIKKIIYAQEDPVIIRETVILEGKIGAIPSISSNICELAWNIHRDALSKSKSLK